MNYMLWKINTTEDINRQLSEALSYYKDKYGEPHSIVVPINSDIDTELDIVEKKTVQSGYIGISQSTLSE